MGPEQVLADRYALVSPLGRGGMGQVWEALDVRLERKVAVKLMTTDAASGDRRFAREATVTAGLAHPCIPAIYDVGSCDDGLYLVMELVDGCTLDDLVAEQGPLPAAWAAAIAGQVAAVLAIAHQNGVLHRDIKPQNVMLTPDGTVKVLDFGVAGLDGQRLSQRITSTGATVGTFGYIAPEQLNGLPPTAQTDLYSLGCLLYEMLAGEPVFTATSPAGLVRMHVEQAPPSLLRRDVPPSLESLLWQLLEKDPARRPAGARQVYDLLLPLVEPSGPLGDINPEAGSSAGVHLYTRLLARLSGSAPAPPVAPTGPVVPAGPVGPVAPVVPAVPPAPGPVYGSPPASAYGTPAAARDLPGWTLRHSLWVLPAILLGGFGAWMSFGYIAARHQKLSWLISSVVYLALMVTAVVLIGASPDDGSGPLMNIAMPMLLGLWPVGVVHTLWVNFAARLPLLRNR